MEVEKDDKEGEKTCGGYVLIGGAEQRKCSGRSYTKRGRKKEQEKEQEALLQ